MRMRSRTSSTISRCRRNGRAVVRQTSGSSSSAFETSWGTGGSASSRPSVRVSMRPGRSRSPRAWQREASSMHSRSGPTTASCSVSRMRIVCRRRISSCLIPTKSKNSWSTNSAVRHSSLHNFARTPHVRFCCHAVDPALERRSGPSDCEHRIFIRSRRSFPVSRSCSKPIGRACKMSSTCLGWPNSCREFVRAKSRSWMSRRPRPHLLPDHSSFRIRRPICTSSTCPRRSAAARLFRSTRRCCGSCSGPRHFANFSIQESSRPSRHAFRDWIRSCVPIMRMRCTTCCGVSGT